MKCNKIMDKFLELENYNDVPVSMKLHFLICPQCRMEASLLREEFLNLQTESPFDYQESISDSIMENIRFIPGEYQCRISSSKWVGVGALIFFSIFMINYSDSYHWLKLIFGVDIILPMSIVLGVVLSSYLVVLMMVNHSVFVKYMHETKWLKKD